MMDGAPEAACCPSYAHFIQRHEVEVESRAGHGLQP